MAIIINPKGERDMELTAKTLKDQLWQTLLEVREKKIDPAHADSVATQAREILRTTNTQMRIYSQAKAVMSDELLNFAGEDKRQKDNL